MLMIPTHVIAFFMAILMVPKDVNQFTIDVRGKRIEWTRQETGWHAVKLDRDDMGIYSVKGTEVTISGEDQVLKTHIGRFLNIPANVNWQTSKEIPVARDSLGDAVRIAREPGKIVLSQTHGMLFESPVSITWQTAAGHAGTAPEAIASLPLAPGEAAFQVKDGEATVNDVLIRRFAIGEKIVTASYHNKSEMKMRPRYTIELYNASGLLVGEDTTGNTSGLFGGPGYIRPGDVGSEELHVTRYPLDRILSKSHVPLPDGWKTVKWIVLKDNQPRTMEAK
jgi:hypothetical protein